MAALLLLDTNNLAHRCWHGSGRRPPHEVFGFALQRLREQLRPTHALAVLDGQGPTWRHDAWPDYKAHRAPAPEGWREYIRRVIAELDGAGVRRVRVAAVEADDLIASYADAATRAGMRVQIVSSDKDLAQLIRDDSIEVLDPKLHRWNAAGVREKWKVWPHSIPDLLALAGDAHDGIPGVPGIGLVTAAKLIEAHGDLEQILDRVELVSRAAVRKALKQHAEQARLFLRLTTLQRDLALPVPLEACSAPRRGNR